MRLYRPVTIVIATVLAVVPATACHEMAHVLAGRAAGGMPTMITSTEVLGDFHGLTPAGFAALGLSGSLVNLLFALAGWWLLRRRPVTAELQLTAWFFLGVNGAIVGTAMLGESLAGFGDWMTVLSRLPAATLLRALTAVLGAAGVALVVRRSGRALGRLIPPGEPSERLAEGRRVVLIGAAASSALMLGASVANPVGTLRGTLLALGAGLGPFIVLLFGTRFVPRVESENPGPVRTGGWPWPVAAAASVAALWLVLGPGVRL